VVAFTNHWDYGKNVVSRAVASREQIANAGGGTRVSISLVAGNSELSSAPLGSWAPTRRPLDPGAVLLRISVDHPSPAYLGDYDRVAVTCR
jgi:hypothetical protein